MDDDRVTRALARMEQALDRAERALAASAAAAAQSAQDSSELSALRRRHEDLKAAVATGLRQLDEVLAGAPR